MGNENMLIHAHTVVLSPAVLVDDECGTAANLVPTLTHLLHSDVISDSEQSDSVRGGGNLNPWQLPLKHLLTLHRGQSHVDG